MELKDTVAMMNSSDYKERFKAEYFQLKIRYDKLKAMLLKHQNGTLEFTPSCPISLLKEQGQHMRTYLAVLEDRAEIEGISLKEGE